MKAKTFLSAIAANAHSRNCYAIFFWRFLLYSGRKSITPLFYLEKNGMTKQLQPQGEKHYD